MLLPMFEVSPLGEVTMELRAQHPDGKVERLFSRVIGSVMPRQGNQTRAICELMALAFKEGHSVALTEIKTALGQLE
jgi:hypothetical protein